MDESPAWQRAQTEAQRESRRQALLTAAATLFATEPISQITIASIAKEAGLAKGSVYRYFATKEEIFLHLLINALEAWFATLVPALLQVHPHGIEPAVRVVLDTLSPRDELLRLLARLYVDIEENLSPEAALHFKTWLTEALLRVGLALEQALGVADASAPLPGQLGAMHMLRFNAVCAGLWPMAHPRGAVAEVLARPEFAPLCIDFWAELERMLTAMLTGFSLSTPRHAIELPWSI